jgi:hypothetical protein
MSLLDNLFSKKTPARDAPDRDARGDQNETYPSSNLLAGSHAAADRKKIGRAHV